MNKLLRAKFENLRQDERIQDKTSAAQPEPDPSLKNHPDDGNFTGGNKPSLQCQGEFAWRPEPDEEDFAHLTTNEDWCIAFYKTGIYKRVHLIHKMNNMPVAADSFFVEKVVSDQGDVWGVFCQKHGQARDGTTIESDPYLLDCFQSANIAMDRVKWLTETMIREIDVRLRMLWGKPAATAGSDEPAKPQAQMANAEAPLKKAGRTATWLQIFPPEEIAKAKASWANDDSKKKGQALVTAMSQYDGMRMVPSFPEEFGVLLAKFPHFRNVIEHIESELFLSNLVGAKKFHFQPILVNGEPGIGKTYFLECLADLMGVPFFKISCGSVHGGFEITGTSQHWRNATPGKVFNALSSTPFASPIILLDEIDKIRDSGEFPVAPAFLDILEPRTAEKFRDEAAAATFDASRCIFVASSNESAEILPALLSRFTLFEVPLPSENQSKAIFERAFQDMLADIGCTEKLVMPDEILVKIASSRMSPRAIMRQLRLQIGNALKCGAPHITFTPEAREKRIGFTA